jgi:hypothetical protein
MEPSGRAVLGIDELAADHDQVLAGDAESANSAPLVCRLPELHECLSQGVPPAVLGQPLAGDD